jgi:Protein of unknown function (DUF1189)
MRLARSITEMHPIVILLILVAAIALSTWGLVLTGGKKLEVWVHRGVDKYDAYLPEITIKHGQASIQGKQPYFVKTGEKNFVAVIDTREGEQNGARNYLKNAPEGVVLTRTNIAVKDHDKIQIIPLKEVPDMVLNARNLRKIERNYMPKVLRLGAILVTFYYIFAKVLQMLVLGLIPYVAARSYNVKLAYGQALKISSAAMILPVAAEVLLDFSNITIPRWFFFYFLIYIGTLVILTIDLVSSPSSGISPTEPINP